MKSSILQGTKGVSAGSTPEPLVATHIYVSSVEIHARKNKTTVNGGDIYIGNSSTQTRVLAPGEAYTITPLAGKKIDLADIWIGSLYDDDAVTWTAIAA